MSTEAAAPRTGITAWLSHYASTAIHSGLPLLFWVRPHWTDKDMAAQNGKVSPLITRDVNTPDARSL